MRLNYLVIAFIFLSAYIACAQIDKQPTAEGQIVGTVLDRQAQPLAHIFVHALLKQTGMYMPTVESDETGQFVIDNLEPGTYEMFGESDANGFPNTALSFYCRQNQSRRTLQRVRWQRWF